MATLLAYLDPGSGSMILQALLGGVAGLFVAVKMFGVRIKETLFFWRKDDEVRRRQGAESRRRRARPRAQGQDRGLNAGGFEPGSFRDPHGRVLLGPEGVFRALSETGFEDWQALERSGLLAELVGEGKLVASEEAEEGTAAALAAELPERPAAVLRHERIPFVSYPYEWSFAMLREAALLQLELTERALDHGLILKDARPYNVQFRGSRPVFIDVSSFERLREGEPWVGYRQFCMLFLYPLMLQAYKGVDFQPLLRGSIDGIPPAQMAALIKGSGSARGVLTHVRLHSRLEASSAERAGSEVRGEMKKAKFSTELIRSNVRRPAQARRCASTGRPGAQRLERVPRGEHLQRR